MTTVPFNPFPAAAQAGSARAPPAPGRHPAVLGAKAMACVPLRAATGSVLAEMFARRRGGRKPPKVETDTPAPRWFLPAQLWVGPGLPYCLSGLGCKAWIL